jgi:hypothetical protein
MNVAIEEPRLLDDYDHRRAYVRGLSNALSPHHPRKHMQYLLMVYESEQWPGLPKEEKRRIALACEQWHQDLVARGIGRAGVGLHPPSTACLVREKNGSSAVTDGPFVETKEVLGGFELIECADRAAAVAIAKTFPALRVGFTMEVRPIMTDDDLERMINA